MGGRDHSCEGCGRGGFNNDEDCVCGDLVHLVRGSCHDEDTLWCDHWSLRYKSDHDPEKATCLACLEAAEEFGERCFSRLADLALKEHERA